MSFITESKKAYNQVKENHIAIAMGKMLDDEGSMILNQLEELERAIEMIRSYIGADYEKQLPAWVQAKVTLGSDYISTVGNYLSSKNEKVTEETIKESVSLEENTFEKIYQMQQDGKTAEDIAKELKLNPALVKKVLGEQIELKEFTDAMLAALKKEYDPLKGKTITTSQYQQLKNILIKLQDGDLEKLQKQNIPFASTGAGSILRVRKSPVKITSVKVPGLEGMAEENQYVAVHVKKGETSVTANSSYEAAKKASEKFGLKNTAGVTVYLTKKDGKEIIHKATEQVEGMAEEKINEEDAYDFDRYVVKKDGSISKDNNDVAVPDNKRHVFASDLKDARAKAKKKGLIKEEEVEETFKDNIVNKLVKPVQDYNKKAAEIKTIDMTDGSAHVRFPKDDTRAMEFYKSKGYKVTTKYEEVEVTEVTEAKEPTGNLKDACWTGYVAIGTKMKNGKRVPNCVPKSEAYKGAKATVENAFKKLKEKK